MRIERLRRCKSILRKLENNKNNMQKQSKWAIVLDRVGGEFYPDPIYTDRERLEKKMQYLSEYRYKHGMKPVVYVAELLTKEREEQHDKEWKRWVSLID